MGIKKDNKKRKAVDSPMEKKNKKSKSSSSPVSQLKKGICIGNKDGLQKSEVRQILDSLLKLKSNSKSKLLDAEDERILVQIAGIKLPKDDRKQMIKW